MRSRGGNASCRPSFLSDPRIFLRRARFHWRMKRLHKFLLIGIVAIFALITWLSFFSRERAYQGKRLSAWLQGYSATSTDPETDEAIRKIGTNALPFLFERPARERLRMDQIAALSR